MILGQGKIRLPSSGGNGNQLCSIGHFQHSNHGGQLISIDCGSPTMTVEVGTRMLSSQALWLRMVLDALTPEDLPRL